MFLNDSERWAKSEPAVWLDPRCEQEKHHLAGSHEPVWKTTLFHLSPESEQWPPSDGKAVHSSLFLYGADLFECPASIWLFTNLNGPCLTVELFWSLLNTNPYFFLYLCTSVLTSVDLSSVNQEFSSLILIKSDTRTGGFSGLILVLHPSIHVWYLHYSPKTDEKGEYILPVWHEKKKGSSYHRARSTKLWEKIWKFISFPVFFLWVG